MNLESIIEKRQTEKSTYGMISFIRHFGKGKTIGIKNTLVVTRSLGWKKETGCKGEPGNFLK